MSSWNLSIGPREDGDLHSALQQPLRRWHDLEGRTGPEPCQEFPSLVKDACLPHRCRSSRELDLKGPCRLQCIAAKVALE